NGAGRAPPRPRAGSGQGPQPRVAALPKPLRRVAAPGLQRLDEGGDRPWGDMDVPRVGGSGRKDPWSIAMRPKPRRGARTDLPPQSPHAPSLIFPPRNRDGPRGVVEEFLPGRGRGRDGPGRARVRFAA